MPTANGSAWQMVQSQHTSYATGKNLPFPPEIRDRIYKHVLAHERMPATLLRWTDTYPPGASFLAILLVSKQTYIEAFHVFYREGCIILHDTNELFSFLKNIGYARRQQVTELEFYWANGDTTKQAFRLLQKCQNLQSLTINCMLVNNAPPVGWQALREVRGLKEVYFKLSDVHIQYYLSAVPQTLQPEVDGRVNLVRHLTEGMTRPRLKKYLTDPDEKIDLFNRKREIFRCTEEAELEAEKGRLMTNPNTWKYERGQCTMTAEMRRYL